MFQYTFIKIKAENKTYQKKIMTESEKRDRLKYTGRSAYSVQHIKEHAANGGFIHNDTIFLVKVVDCPLDAKKIFKAMFLGYDLNKYNTAAFSSNQSIDDTIEYNIKNCNRTAPLCYYVGYIIFDNKPIPVALSHLYEGTTANVVVVYFSVLKDVQGMGIGTSIIKAFLSGLSSAKNNSQHMYYSMCSNLLSMEATVAKDNKPSNAVFLKLGFKQSQLQRANVFEEAYIYTFEIK